MFAIAYLTDNQQLRNALLSAESIYHELILFCIVANAASIIIFVSKFNLLQVVAPQGGQFQRHLFTAVCSSRWLVPLSLLQ